MSEIAKEITAYQAADGTLFTSKEACEVYGKSLLAKLKDKTIIDRLAEVSGIVFCHDAESMPPIDMQAEEFARYDWFMALNRAASIEANRIVWDYVNFPGIDVGEWYCVERVDRRVNLCSLTHCAMSVQRFFKPFGKRIKLEDLID